MDDRPIGVFDSGLGGLTTVKELITTLPNENIIYFGDTGRVPYGTRSKETIIKYTRQNIRFLRQFNIKLLIIACGTASTAALDTVSDEYDIPMLGVVSGASKEAARVTKNRRVGLIATTAAIRSGVYEKTILSVAPDISVTAQACPLLVTAVENGRFRHGDRLAELLVHEYLAPIKKSGADTLILGCTHFPLLKAVISEELGKNVTLIDSGREAARSAERMLESHRARRDNALPGTQRYYVSDSTEQFAALGSMFLEREIGGTVEKIDIEKY